jgi:hypothetical protein
MNQRNCQTFGSDSEIKGQFADQSAVDPQICLDASR